MSIIKNTNGTNTTNANGGTTKVVSAASMMAMVRAKSASKVTKDSSEILKEVIRTVAGADFDCEKAIIIGAYIGSVRSDFALPCSVMDLPSVLTNNVDSERDVFEKDYIGSNAKFCVIEDIDFTQAGDDILVKITSKFYTNGGGHPVMNDWDKTGSIETHIICKF